MHRSVDNSTSCLMHTNILIILIFVFSSFNVYLATKVIVTVTLRCKKPYSTKAQVFLMEKDFSNSALELWDEDDTLDLGDYYFEQIPEKRLTLHGEDYEIFGIHPYIYVYHRCSTTKEWGSQTIHLDYPQYLNKRYNVIIDLDAGTSKIS